ncbi:hypothetical protein [Streptomyces sp. NPDC006997]|uniref:hypothetical protein n=1 Tax=Streptomyces sp. NPDC006997 TaxID=3155356 RepID=UPI0033CEB8BE
MTVTAEAAVRPDPQTPTPVWSARRVTEADHAAVLGFFTEPGFRFRTPRSEILAEWQVLALLDDARLLLADGVPAGLYAVENSGADHACHLVLQLRLSARLPLTAWASAYHEVVRGLRHHRELVRLAVQVVDDDERGLAAARAAGFTEEGVLPGMTVDDGHRRGQVFLSRLWEPVS